MVVAGDASSTVMVAVGACTVAPAAAAEEAADVPPNECPVPTKARAAAGKAGAYPTNRNPYTRKHAEMERDRETERDRQRERERERERGRERDTERERERERQREPARERERVN